MKERLSVHAASAVRVYLLIVVIIAVSIQVLAFAWVGARILSIESQASQARVLETPFVEYYLDQLSPILIDAAWFLVLSLGVIWVAVHLRNYVGKAGNDAPEGRSETETHLPMDMGI